MSSDSGDRAPAEDASPDSTLLTLDRAECLRLLAASHVGRVAVATGTIEPVIRPVNYVFDDRSQCVVFRTSAGSKLHALLMGRRAAFEVDELDHRTRTGWSVIVVGIVEEVTQPIELRRLEKLGLDVWAPGDPARWVRVRAYRVSGRRIAREAA